MRYDQQPTPQQIFDEPLAYLASFGIEVEIVSIHEAAMAQAA